MSGIPIIVSYRLFFRWASTFSFFSFCILYFWIGMQLHAVFLVRYSLLFSPFVFCSATALTIAIFGGRSLLWFRYKHSASFSYLYFSLLGWMRWKILTYDMNRAEWVKKQLQTILALSIRLFAACLVTDYVKISVTSFLRLFIDKFALSFNAIPLDHFKKSLFIYFVAASILVRVLSCFILHRGFASRYS